LSQGGIVDVNISNPHIPTSFETDSGTAVPLANIIQIRGGTGVTTTGASNIVTVESTLAILSITGNSGDPIVPILDNWNIIGEGSFTTSGDVPTATLTLGLTGLTNHAVLIGAGTSTITKVSPGVSGIPLISQGASFDPTFGTAQIVGGGTASTSFNVNGVVISSTTATGPLTALTLANGQFVIGSTGVAPVASTLTSSAGTITITPGAGTLNIDLAGGSIGIDSFSPDSGTDPIVPTAAGLVNMDGSGSITTVGSLNTLTTQLTGLTNHAVLVGAGTSTITKLALATNGQVLLGSTGADPIFATLTSSDSSITFTTGAGTLGLTTGSAVALSFPTDSGTATPSSGALTIAGGTNLNSSGAGSTVTLNLDTTVTGLTSLTSTTILGTTFDTNVVAAGVTLVGTTLSADGTDAAIDITITPKGTGSVVMSKVDIDSGTIDGTTIGATSATTGKFTTATASTFVTAPTTTNISITSNSIATSGTDANRSINLTPAGAGAVFITEAAIISGVATFQLLDVDNININDNTISSSNVNGNILLTPNGSGKVGVSYGTQNAVTYYGATGFLEGAGPLTNGQLVIGFTGAPPVAGAITSTGGTIDITLGTGTINIETDGAVSNSFATDSGTATPAAGVLTIAGGTNIGSTGAGSTVTLNLDTTVTGLTSLTSTTILGTTFDTNVVAAGVTLVGTTLSADGTDAAIDITITPKGTGSVVMSKVDINGGAVDGTTIGLSSSSTGTFTTLDCTDFTVDNLNINGNTIISMNANGAINITPDGTGNVVISKIDCNSGTIDGTTIGASSATTAIFTTSTATTSLATTFDTNVAAAGVTLAGTTLSADGSNANIPITITPKGTSSIVMSRVDINAGTIDATTIGTSSASPAIFTTVACDSIDFGETVLSVYEEGTWTPGVSSAAGTPTLTASAGRYIRIGNSVTVWGYASVGVGTGTGNMSITGLPFTSSNISNLNSIGAVRLDNVAIFSTTNFYCVAEIAPNVTVVQIRIIQDDASASDIMDIETCIMYFTITYSTGLS